MSKPDGGPAFPVAAYAAQENEMFPPASGMSLRDWFAGHALSGFIASYAGPDVASPPAGFVARFAYEYADAMLAEREK